jgi:hypothetical protein
MLQKIRSKFLESRWSKPVAAACFVAAGASPAYATVDPQIQSASDNASSVAGIVSGMGSGVNALTITIMSEEILLLIWFIVSKFAHRSTR